MNLLEKGLQQGLYQKMNLLEKAIVIAVLYHVGQKDKANETYIKHPLAVMNRVKTEDEKIVAVLHDVVEDTSVTIEDLRKEGFLEHHLEGLRSVTKIKGETREESIYRASQNIIGIEVKKADLKENGNIERIPEHMRTEKDIQRTKNYKRELEILENVGVIWFWEEKVNGKMGWIKREIQ